MTYLDDTPAPALALEAWRQYFNLSPWHFWGMSNGRAPSLRRNDGGCDSVVRQYAWQDGDAASRSEVLRAIAEAEQILTDELHYAPLARYAEFVVPWPRAAGLTTRWAAAYTDATWRRLSVALPEGAIVALGVEAISLLDTVDTDPGGGLAYADADGDGLLDTFTATLTVAADTDPDAVAVYVPAAERFDGSGRSERWRIQPVRASLSGTTLTVIGRSWTCVRPILYEGMPTASSGGGGAGGLDPADTGIYLAGIEICTRATDPNGETADDSQAVLEWDTRPGYLAGWCADGSATDPAAVARVVARAGIRDAWLGLVTPAAAVRNATTGVWAATCPAAWRPDRVVVRAYAGGRADKQRDLTRAVCQLAAALLTRPICACADVSRQLYDAQFDLTLAGRQDELYSTRDPDLDNPFGTRRGAVAAYKAIKRLQLTRTVSF